MIITWIWFTIVIFILINSIICAFYDLTREVGIQVGPKWSIWFFPLYILKCKQHCYKTIDDKVEATMKRIFGPGWTKDWMN